MRVKINVTRDQIKEEILFRTLQSSFLHFVEYVFENVYKKDFIKNWHHIEIVDILEAVYLGKLSRVLINEPPRYTKTELVVICFISWCYVKNKNCDFLYSSYSIDLVRRNTGTIQRILTDQAIQKFFPIEIDSSESSKTLWTIIGGGTMRAVNSGGAVTGFGAGGIQKDEKFKFSGALIIDDPIKAGEERYKSNLEMVKDNFEEVLASRLNDKRTPIIVVMQRLHEDDLSGHLLSGKSVTGDYDHFCFPAIKVGIPNGYDNRKEGEALWEKKHSIEDLLEMKKRNPRYFAGQMQQSPSPQEGDVFKKKWITRYGERPEVFNRGEVVSVDLNSTEDGGSNACMSRYGIHDDKVYLTDQRVKQWGFPEAVVSLRDFLKRPYNALLIEAKANGPAMIATLKNLKYHGIIPIRPNHKKLYRFNEVAALYLSGQVLWPEDYLCPWIIDHEKEFLLFPKGKFDDRVDAETQMLRYFMLNFANARTSGSPVTII